MGKVWASACSGRGTGRGRANTLAGVEVGNAAIIEIGTTTTSELPTPLCTDQRKIEGMYRMERAANRRRHDGKAQTYVSRPVTHPRHPSCQCHSGKRDPDFPWSTESARHAIALRQVYQIIVFEIQFLERGATLGIATEIYELPHACSSRQWGRVPF